MRNIKDVRCQMANHKLVGKLVVKDDAPAEGILVDMETKSKFLIFGDVNNDSLNLTAYTSKENNKILLLSFLRGDKSYLGEGYVFNGHKKQYMGPCEFHLLEPDYYRDVNEGEIIGLLSRTHILKDEMSNIASKAYDEYLNDRQPKKKKVRK